MHHGICRQRRIAKTQTRNLQPRTFDRKLLNISIAQRIADHLVLYRQIELVRDQQAVNCVRGNVYDVSGFRQRSIKKGKLRANRIIQLRIPEPRKIIVISRNPRRFRHMKIER